MSAVAESSSLPGRTIRADVIDLLASMRFAIALLTIICIASTIGTVLKQGEPLVNYVDTFGPFWAQVFGSLGLFRIYGSPWFLVILAFLVVSTSLCIARNAPKILVDVRTFKENLRVKALDSFHHRAHGSVSQGLPETQQQVLAMLGAMGWKVKTQTRQGEGTEAAGVMIAARRGAANKLGYIAAHSAIVLVCVGGLLDGDTIMKFQAWMGNLQAFQGNKPTEQSVLSLNSPAYRASLYVPEGARNGQAVINVDAGMLVQPLPFDVELKKFMVDYYETGMPKRFASEIVVHDLEDKSEHKATVEVNHPFVYKGVTIFQSSFQDGGSQVKLKPIMLNGREAAVDVFPGQVGGQPLNLPQALTGGAPQSLEITELRPINVENMAQADPANDGGGPKDVRGVNLASLSKHLGSGAGKSEKQLKNIGPSITYKLRDSAGQAREFQNFMVPVQFGEQSVYLMGVRNSTNEGFRYLRLPADSSGSMDTWLNMRTALFNPAMRAQAAQRFAAKGAPIDKPEAQQQLAVSAQRLLDIFAGMQFDKNIPNEAGLVGLGVFIESVVPEADRERAAETMMQMLNGAMAELLAITQEGMKQPVTDLNTEKGREFLTQVVLAQSDAMAYPVAAVFALDGFEQRQASVFQVTRTPGRNVVYLGCVLLIVGVFAMLYVRERRVWVWLQADGSVGTGGGTAMKLALSSTRQTLDVDAEFDRLREALLPGAKPLDVADAAAVKG
jgi:cytochrome c biogenesis protein